MAYDARQVANWFLRHAKRHGARLSPMKLQKLIYFAHGWHLAIFDEPLISDQVEAWSYGPVIPEVYHEFKRFGSGDITALATDESGEPFDPPATPEAVELLERIWEIYGTSSALQLSQMTHVAGAPWKAAWDRSAGKKSVDIRDEEIRAYFVQLGNSK